MSIEGIWTGEIYGPYGWENCGVYIIERGLMLGGNDRHYSAGSYSLDGKHIEADLSGRFHGRPRTMFGQNRVEFDFTLSGEIEEGLIEGDIRSPSKPWSGVKCRFTKRTEIPRSELLAQAC